MGVQMASHDEAERVGEMGAETSWPMRDEITGWWKRLHLV